MTAILRVSIALLLAALVCAFVLSTAATATAQGTTQDITIEQLPGASVFGDFVVGPGKVEVELAPGESRVVNITVSNRMGEDREFSITTEDFTGSRDPNQTVVLLGDDRGPYTLKDYLQPATTTFMLAQGERATIPVRITVPTDAEAGGLYGSALVSTVSRSGGATSGGGGAAIVSRIGVLFFVTVPGDVKHEGRLAEFDTVGGQRYFGSGPIDFRLLYENTGSIHLNPYGTITVTNITGEVVGELEIEPWFALPGSLRLREISWDRELLGGLLFGRYVAHAQINRGYGDIVDEAEIAFWVIPWKIALGVFVGLALVIFAIRWLMRNFSISRK